MGFASKVASFMKSLTGGEAQGKDEKELDPKADEGQEEAGEGTGGGEGEDEGKDMGKGRLVDATDVLNGLVTELNDMNKSLKALAER
jgi:hypothetical protein